MAQKLKEKGSIRHVMDFRHPHAVVVVLAAVLCAAVLALLWLDPGQRGNQLEGVEMSVVRAMDQGVPVDLPEDMARELVRLIRVYDKGDYNDLSGYRPAPGDIYLSDQHGGTVYYLTGSLDSVPVLVRINHDGYGWTSAFEGLTLTGMEEDPAYRIWEYQLEEYLTAGRAEELYALKTPYIGNHVACGEILKALNVSQAVGPYTIELRTEKEPYGITLHLENCPALEEERAGNTRFLRQAGTLFTALVDNASFFNWDYVDAPKGVTGAGIQPGLKKPVDREAFLVLYDSFRQAVGEAGFEPGGNGTGPVLPGGGPVSVSGNALAGYAHVSGERDGGQGRVFRPDEPCAQLRHASDQRRVRQPGLSPGGGPGGDRAEG